MTSITPVPPMSRHILLTAEAAEFVRISVPHWRRLYRSGEAPAPIRLGARKYAWRVADLIAWIDQRGAPNSAA